MMTLAQQRKAIKILKGIVANDDEQNAGQAGYCDHEDTHEIRMLLIQCSALPDRRKKAMPLSGRQAGGNARAKSLTPERRSEIARAAAKKRWQK